MDCKPPHILFYDGTCRFCDRFVQLGLRHDRGGAWRYSALQSEFAARELARYGIDASVLDSIHALLDYGTPRERLVSSSDAAVFFLKTLGGDKLRCNIISLRGSCILRGLGWIFGGVPRFIREPAYRLIARNRYRWFGSYDTCKVPEPGQAELFIDE